MKAKRLMALLLCLLTLIGVIPFGGAFAAGSTVTIESQTNSAFDYLQYYSDGAWKDLNTPRHWIEQTGEVVYCVEHSAGNPHGQTYTATSPSSVFSGSTLAGITHAVRFVNTGGVNVDGVVGNVVLRLHGRRSAAGNGKRPALLAFGAGRRLFIRLHQSPPQSQRNKGKKRI